MWITINIILLIASFASMAYAVKINKMEAYDAVLWAAVGAILLGLVALSELFRG